jgi:hypothetical protein
MTTDIKRLIRKKQRLYKKSKKSKKPSHKKAFKNMRSFAMILVVSLSILIGTLSGPFALLGFNLFNAFSTPFSPILMSFIDTYSYKYLSSRSTQAKYQRIGKMPTYFQYLN